MGIDPGPYSLRELAEMLKARGLWEWEQTLTIGQIIVDSRPHFGKGRPKKIDLLRLNPFRESTGPVSRNQGIPIEGDFGEILLDAISRPEQK